jgi:HSP20 family protein
MQLTRYQALTPFEIMDRLWNAHAGQFNNDETTAAADWSPSVDIKEEAERFVIHADVPGVDPKDIEISMEDGILSLSGERKSENRSEQDGWKRTERLTGRFLRRFTLPEGTDAENISAQGSHGVLEIVIPKAAKAQPRKIAVKVTAPN